uniref:Uncharacterized protein n=1 Tax=Arundo donax TaxID=35708 RepID=A0A0A9BTC1_ARUDO
MSANLGLVIILICIKKSLGNGDLLTYIGH